MLTAAVRQERSSRPTDDIDGEPPRAQNTPICTATWPPDLDPQAARNGGYRAMPAASGRHATRLAFQSVILPADYDGGHAGDRQGRRAP
jgi:hypothetical protein